MWYADDASDQANAATLVGTLHNMGKGDSGALSQSRVLGEMRETPEHSIESQQSAGILC